MSNHLKKITARAKQIHKAHPAKKWTDCIKQASRELKSGKKLPAKKKVAAKKKSSNRQTGSSNLKADKRIKAKPPGKRVVKHADGTSHVYYERRKNRSDKSGSLAGVPAATLKKALLDQLWDKVGKKTVAKAKATKVRIKKKIQKEISSTLSEIRKLK